MDTVSQWIRTKLNLTRKGWAPRLFVTVVGMSWIAVACFAYYQYQREKDFKVELLTTQLMQLNEELAMQEQESPKALNAMIKLCERNSQLKDLRVTIMDDRGNVLSDNIESDPTQIGNHLERPEVQQALKHGNGYTIRRNSATLGKDYFYVASYYKESKLIVRSALPYNVTLAHALSADRGFMWFALMVLMVLTIVFYYQTRVLGNMMTSEQEHEQTRLKRQLTLNMSHELKTPVASIQGYVESILENPDMDAERRSQFLNRCFAQTRRLTSLLRDINTLTRMDEASDQLEMTQLDLAKIVQGIAGDIQLQLQEHGMRMDSHLPASMLIHGNEGLLYSVFRNLIDNSIAYAGDGTTITLRGDTQNGQWHFVYADNGVGVKPEHLGRLFERFYRVDKGRSRKIGGTGLGLAIVKNAVILHGGTIKASIPEGGGLEFEFWLSMNNV